MANSETKPSSRGAVPVVRLAELSALARDLAARVRGSGFEPEVIVYVEAGARLLAHELAGMLGTPLIPIWVRRGGHGLKRKLAPLAARLPTAARDWLRRIEERSGVHRVTRRSAELPAEVVLTGQRVLLVDDAADTGRTLQVARGLVLARGVAALDLRTAVLAATTREAQAAVDFFVLDHNCRMPWSADSDERGVATEKAAKLSPVYEPRRF